LLQVVPSLQDAEVVLRTFATTLHAIPMLRTIRALVQRRG
jgi:hypothetical protein